MQWEIDKALNSQGVMSKQVYPKTLDSIDLRLIEITPAYLLNEKARNKKRELSEKQTREKTNGFTNDRIDW